ncbi:MAG TPA: RsmE family RNA methyltransferase [Thermoanaerobaculia bacterium]|nr:RsmE family RNA methyltransferase [Thermoanaerobaculia bacterium]
MSAPPRVLVPLAPLEPGREVTLPEEEVRHLRVSRVGPGEELVLLDGRGTRAAAHLSASGRAASVTALLPPRGEPARRVTVLLGVGEPARVEWAVEKGTECGAAAFVLVAAARSQRAHVAAAAARIERLRRIAAEAVKQCDRSVVPEVGAPAPLAGLLDGRRGRLLVARPGAAPLPAEQLPAGDLAVAIGPEGGFDDVEERLLDAAGAVPVGLGGRVLRLETAVVAALVRLVDTSPT